MLDRGESSTGERLNSLYINKNIFIYNRTISGRLSKSGQMVVWSPLQARRVNGAAMNRIRVHSAGTIERLLRGGRMRSLVLESEGRLLILLVSGLWKKFALSGRLVYFKKNTIAFYLRLRFWVQAGHLVMFITDSIELNRIVFKRNIRSLAK